MITRLYLFISISILALSLTGCGGSDDLVDPSQSELNQAQQEAIEQDMAESESQQQVADKQEAGREFILLDKKWKLVSFDTQPPLKGTEITANFSTTAPAAAEDEDMDSGVISGSAGCNSYDASFEIIGTAGLDIDAPTTTEMACAEEIMEQENRFLLTLDLADSYALNQEELTIYASGGGTLIFMAGDK